jgi:hypothetical protein
MAALPPLHGDILLEVFTHKSLRHSALPNDEYGDNERLAELGHQVFDLAVTYCLFLKRPMLTAQEMQARLNLQTTSHGSVELQICLRFKRATTYMRSTYRLKKPASSRSPTSKGGSGGMVSKANYDTPRVPQNLSDLLRYQPPFILRLLKPCSAVGNPFPPRILHWRSLFSVWHGSHSRMGPSPDQPRVRTEPSICWLLLPVVSDLSPTTVLCSPSSSRYASKYDHVSASESDGNAKEDAHFLRG